MIQKFVCFILMSFSGLAVAVGQNTPSSGFTVVTQKRGTPPPESPQLNSERYKLYFLAKEFDLEYNLLYHEFSGGKYKANERYLEVVSRSIIQKNRTFTIEFIPELYHADSHLKIFVNVPGMTTVRRKTADGQDKCIKYVLFDWPKQAEINSSSPVLLAYEDNRITNKVETFLSKYVNKSGVLPNTERMLDILKLNVPQYSLLFYTTKELKNENK